MKRSAAVAIGSCAAMLCASVAAALPGDGALASVPANRGTMVQVTPTLLQKVASGAYPDVFIADWRDYTAPVRSWFVSDGIHYQPTGALGSADYLSRWITFMFDEPCPKPMTVGGPNRQPVHVTRRQDPTRRPRPVRLAKSEGAFAPSVSLQALG